MTLLEVLIFVPIGIVCWTVATGVLLIALGALLGAAEAKAEEKKK